MPYKERQKDRKKDRQKDIISRASRVLPFLRNNDTLSDFRILSKRYVKSKLIDLAYLAFPVFVVTGLVVICIRFWWLVTGVVF